MKNLTIMLYAFVAFMLLSVNDVYGKTSTPSCDSAPVTWYDKTSHSLLKTCDVQYYVNGDTLFTNQEFKNIGFLYSDNTTGKMVLLQRSLLFKHNQKKNGWWYVVFSPGCVTHPAPNCHLTAIALRYCQTPDSRNKTHICPDAYLYNVTEEISHSKGEQTLNSNLQKIYKYIK